MKNAQIIIIGGGLAGLTAAIDLCQKNFEVVLVEKAKYPHHKVCGEYLSKEVTPYFQSLGIYLEELKTPEVSRMEFSSISGKTLECDLGLGGYGISRYTLDHHLFEKATLLGCNIIHETVEDVKFKKNKFQVTLSDKSCYQSQFVLGAYGKRSNLDKTLNRQFIERQSGWLAVKSHYQNNTHPGDLVSLHNFEGGYCGLSRTELGAVNVCYLASYKSFQRFKNTDDFKNKVLMKNPILKEFFENSARLFEKDLSIAQVSFDKKSLINDHILMIGDAGGLIHPLCGNGMAMAIHSAKIAAKCIHAFYNNKLISRVDIEKEYKESWKANFSSRMKSGRILQKILLNQKLSDISHTIIKTVPGLMPQIIRRTHGNLLYV